MTDRKIALLWGLTLMIGTGFGMWSLVSRDLDYTRLGTVTVDGEVVDHKQDTGVRNAGESAVYRFGLPNGRIQSVTDSVFARIGVPDLGEHVTLTYPTGKPELAEPRRPITKVIIHLAVLAFMALGLWMLALGIRGEDGDEV